MEFEKDFEKVSSDRNDRENENASECGCSLLRSVSRSSLLQGMTHDRA